MTDYTYAAINDSNIVVNIIASDNDNSVDLLRLLIPDASDVILVTDKTGPAYIGGDLLENKFRMPKPYNSWIWEENSWSWEAPIPYPEGGNGYIWDEETISWIEIPSTAISD